MLILIAAAIATFLSLPYAEELTLPRVIELTLYWYGPENIHTITIIWRVLIAALIFAVIRSLLNLIFSAATLAIAMRILRGGRGRS